MWAQHRSLLLAGWAQEREQCLEWPWDVEVCAGGPRVSPCLVLLLPLWPLHSGSSCWSHVAPDKDQLVSTIQVILLTCLFTASSVLGTSNEGITPVALKPCMMTSLVVQD